MDEEDGDEIDDSDIEEMDDDNMDDGFVVPHGYLSDDEGDAEDRCLINDDPTIQRKVSESICMCLSFCRRNWVSL